MTDDELEKLLHELESDRVERKASIADGGKLREAVCAFANDMPNHHQPGVVFVGVSDDGSCANLGITDQLLQTLAGMRDDGGILPLPRISVQKKTFRGCTMAVVVVQPSDAPPVRYRGRTWIRVGPRRAIATPEEERRLAERRRARDLPFDLRPLQAASLSDLDQDWFCREYLPSALARDVLAQNDRSIEQQLASLRFVSIESPHAPTIVGLLVAGYSPTDYIPGAYIQFLRIDGTELSDPLQNRKELHGPAISILRRIDELLEAHVRIGTDITSTGTEIQRPDYPVASLQQLVRNAVMHRDFENTNAPIRITWFNDRIEIQNPGGPFGQVTRENFGQPGITDYRNPHFAEALKTLGFVQRFGVGIQIARKALLDNGNPAPEFRVEENHVLATVRRKP